MQSEIVIVNIAYGVYESIGITELATKIGKVTLPDTAASTDSFTWTLQDKDLNNNALAKDAYTVVLTGTGPFALQRGGLAIGNIAELQIKVNGDNPSFAVPLSYTLVETTANSGIFASEISMADIYASSSIEPEADDVMRLIYFDHMEEDTVVKSDTIQIQG